MNERTGSVSAGPSPSCVPPLLELVNSSSDLGQHKGLLRRLPRQRLAKLPRDLHSEMLLDGIQLTPRTCFLDLGNLVEEEEEEDDEDGDEDSEEE